MFKRILCIWMGILVICGSIPLQARAADVDLEVGGIHILNTDVMGNPLEGASFRVYRELEDEDLVNHSVEKEILHIGGENRILRKEMFWTDRTMTGPKEETVTSGQGGEAAIYGLPYGTYYLVEEKAPVGYNRILEPIRITIHKYSHLTAADNVCDDQDVLIDNTLHIINVRYLLPDTGNLGAIQLAAGGTGVLFSSAALLLLNRKRWK